MEGTEAMTPAGNAAHNRATLERFNEIITTRDYDALDEVLTSDFVEEIPQSGERVRGIPDFRKTIEEMPGIASAPIRIQRDPYVSTEGSHYVMTPTFNVVKVEDSADEMTSYVKARYPDGSDWYVVTFTTFRDGKICKDIHFFAPLFEAPVWRRQWVQQMDAGAERS